MNAEKPVRAAGRSRPPTGPPRAGDKLRDVTLRRVDGSAVRLSEMIDRPTIVAIVRYYGCMPCRDFLLALDELRHFPWWRMLDPRTARNYLRALRRARQGAITNHPLQAPGVIALDADLRLLLVHRGQTLGDYPPAPDVLAAVTGLGE